MAGLAARCQEGGKLEDGRMVPVNALHPARRIQGYVCKWLSALSLKIEGNDITFTVRILVMLQA